MNPPKPCTGTGAMANWLNQLRAFCISIRPKSAPGYRLIPRPDGMTFQFDIHGGGAPPASGTLLSLKFEAFGFGGDPANIDFITCSGKQVLLPPNLRFSVTHRMPYGIRVDYSLYTVTTSPPSQSRIAKMAGVNITQYITEQYQVGDTIYCMKVADGQPGSGSGFLVDLNLAARVFAGP